jgi:SAM-dependent methyltransferase
MHPFSRADAYDRFMGIHASKLAPPFADFAGVRRGMRALDVGCGPGALTSELVKRLGPEAVSAVDPSEPLVAAVRTRHPQVDVRRAVAECLPFDDGAFDVSLAQLVVHFMTDPLVALGEMRRVARSGGVVAACVWDHGGGTGPLAVFWAAVHSVDPDAAGEGDLAGTRSGQLEALFRGAGLRDVVETSLATRVEYSTFDAWWEPFTLAVGPAGAYLAGVDDAAREAIRDACLRALGEGPFTIEGRAWAARGKA